MEYSGFSLAAALGAGLTLIAPAALAVDAATRQLPPSILVEDGAAERVELANRLPTLTQQVASAACRLHHGLDADHAVYLLDEASRLFAATVSLLTEGAPDHVVSTAETSPRLRRGLSELTAAWAPAAAAAERLAAAPQDAAALAEIYETTEALRLRAAAVASDVAGVHAKSASLLETDALMLTLAGQQALHAQRASHLACRTLFDGATEARLSELAEVTAYLDTALTVLSEGQPAVGLPPAPSEDLRDDLGAARLMWAGLPELVGHVVTGDPLSEEERLLLMEGLDVQMTMMESITRLYVDYSKRSIMTVMVP